MRELLFLAILIPSFLFSQSHKSEDIFGDWTIMKCEVYINNVLCKTSYLIEQGGLNNKILEGKYIGNLDEKISSIMRSITGSTITFHEDSTVTWDASISELNISGAFWQLSQSGEIIVGKLQNKTSLKPILAVFRIITETENLLYLKTFELGAEIRLTLNK